MKIKQISEDVRRVKFSFAQKIVIIICLLFHISLLFSVSNRGEYGNKFFGIWRHVAWDTSGWIARAGDYFAIYEAGHQALLGRPVYQVQPEMNFLPKSESMMRAPYTATFRYPPLLAYTLAIVLNILPPMMSYKLWILFNEMLIFLGLYLTVTRAKNTASAFYLIIIWLCFYPIHIEYYLGQFSLFMGFLIFFCGLNLLNNNHTKAINWWGASIFLKVYTIPFALFWMIRKNIKMPIIWLSFFFISSILYFIIFPSDFKIFYDRGIAGRLFSKQEAKEQIQNTEKTETDSSGSGAEAKAPELYWGSLGVQRGVLAITRFFYLEKDETGHFKTPFWSHYVLFLVILFPFPFLIKAIFDKEKNPLIILSLFALSWFFWYFDTWEHHYTLLLPIFALLVSENILKGWRVAILYIIFASPSLWIFFASPETNPLTPQNDILYFILESLYYIIKPAGIIYLFLFLFKKK